MRSLGPPLGWAVQAASVHMSTSLSRSGPGRESSPGKFNFGVGMMGLVINLVGMEVWKRFDSCLGRVMSLPRRFN